MTCFNVDHNVHFTIIDFQWLEILIQNINDLLPMNIDLLLLLIIQINISYSKKKKKSNSFIVLLS